MCEAEMKRGIHLNKSSKILGHLKLLSDVSLREKKNPTYTIVGMHFPSKINKQKHSHGVMEDRDAM